MKNKPEISLIVSTFQKPRHLRLVLASIEAQRGVDGKFEVIVTDDGSTDETHAIIAEYSARVPFDVRLTTHPHGKFHLTRCHNEGVLAARADYLLFLDGDCVIPANHVAIHLAQRQPRTAMIGDAIYLDEHVAAAITPEQIVAGDLNPPLPAAEVKRHRKTLNRFWFYNLIHHPTKPYKLRSGNCGMWKADLEAVNGFDENYQGWGCEDDDLGRRLRKSSVRLKSILKHTFAYHIWHPRDPSAPKHWSEGPNVPYYLRRGVLTRCRNGLIKRTTQDLAVRVIGAETMPFAVERMIAGRILPRLYNERPEIELVVLPARDKSTGTFAGKFSRHADCRVLLAMDPTADITRLAAHADIVIAPHILSFPVAAKQYPVSEFERALAEVA